MRKCSVSLIDISCLYIKRIMQQRPTVLLFAVCDSLTKKNEIRLAYCLVKSDQGEGYYTSCYMVLYM